MTKQNRNVTLLTWPTVVLASLIFTATTSHAQLLVYEGFQYGTAGANRAGSDLLHGQPDGSGGDINATGLGGTWQDISGPGNTSTDSFMQAGSLSFGDLTTTGNHVRTDTNQNNDLFTRSITPDLSGGSDIWFSFLANKLQNNNSAAEGGVVIGNQDVDGTLAAGRDHLLHGVNRECIILTAG